MKISIVIPTYNVSRYITKCIESCLIQNYDDFEIVIVDDNSKDKTLEKIKQFLNEHSNIRLFKNEENLGVHYTRMYGVKQSVGDYIFLLDGDDYIPGDALQKLFNKWKETKADIIDGDFIKIDEKGLEYENFNSYELKGLLTPTDYLHVLIKNKSLYQTFKIIRKELFSFVSINENLTIGEDAIAIVQMIKAAGSIAKVNEVVYNYLRRTDSVTVNPKTQNLIDAYKSSELVINEIQAIGERFDNEVSKIRLINIVNYCNYYHITGAYRKNLRYNLLKNISTKRLKELKFSTRTTVACVACLISPAFSNKVLRNKYILF